MSRTRLEVDADAYLNLGRRCRVETYPVPRSRVFRKKSLRLRDEDGEGDAMRQ